MIAFTGERWERIREVYRTWWAGKLDRPVIHAELCGRDPGRPRPAAPLLTQASCADLSWSADELIDTIDWELSGREYRGDAYPYFNMDAFGPGILAAFLGASLDNSSGRAWFHPKAVIPIGDLHFTWDQHNIWYRRMCDIYQAGMRRWKGLVKMGLPDLGGALDVLAVFRTTEGLLLDLYDAPGEVKRCLDELQPLWMRAFRELSGLLAPQGGYVDWSGIWSEVPSYILQSDFSFLIGPAMFDEFALGELKRTSGELGRSFYHLDGTGEIPHLDSLLTIETNLGVQWVPGEGKPDCTHWPEVYRKIFNAGKLTQVIGGPEIVEAVARQTGRPGMIHSRQYVDSRDSETTRPAVDAFRRLGVEL